MKKTQHLHPCQTPKKYRHNLSLYYPMVLLQTIHHPPSRYCTVRIWIITDCIFRIVLLYNSYFHLEFCSPRSVRLVDYDDDEDDEDYKPPPRKHTETSDEDEGTMESLRLKRKLASKDREPELAKRQRLGKNSKPKESVFAALCTTLSQEVLPNKKTARNMHTTHTADGVSNSGEGKSQENEHAVSRSCADSNNSEDEDNKEKEPATSRGCFNRLHGTSENRQLGGGLPIDTTEILTRNGCKWILSCFLEP